MDPGGVERPRISDVMAAVPPGASILLVAPPGYGATTAAAHAVTGSGATVAWVDLSGVASESAWGRLRDVVAALPGVEAPDPDSDLDIAWVAGALSGASDVWLVVDDLDSAAHGDLAARLCELSAALPAGVRLAITSHDAGLAAMPWPLSTQRVGKGTLALTTDESVELLLSLAPGLDGPDIDRIMTLAQGWPAAVAAAGRHAAADERLSAPLWLENDGVELLLGGWLAGIPAEVSELLLETVVLDDVSVESASAVTGRECASTFRWLLDNSAYVDLESADADGPTLSRHPLLSSLLMRRTRDRNLTPAHRAAAEWFVTQGRVSDAVDQLLAAGLTHEAATLVRLHENAALASGSSDQVHSWYSALPTEALGDEIEHLLRLAWSRALTGDRSGAALAAEQLAIRVDELNDPEARGSDGTLHAGQLSLLRSYVALMSGDPDAAMTHARRAMDEFLGDPPTNGVQVAPLVLARGLLWSGQTTDARRLLEGLSPHRLPTDSLRESVARGVRAQALVLEGRIREAAVLSHAAEHWHASQRLEPITSGLFSAPVAQGMVLVEGGHSGEGRGLLRAVADAAAERQMAGEAAFALAALARAEGADGRLAEGLQAVSQARGLLRSSAPGSALNTVLSQTEAWLRILTGDTQRAERLVAVLPPGEQRTLLWCRLSLRSRPAAVERTLMAFDPRTPRQAVETRLILAESALRSSPKLADVHLLRAADIADEHGLELAFVGLPGQLLSMAESAGRKTSNDVLIRLTGLARHARQTRTSDGEAPAANAALSAGEMELIALLPSRMTMPEIAAALGVTTNTIKTRTQRLYRKLSVQGRNEAVDVARQRGLVP